jgi:hypothetical protein
MARRQIEVYFDVDNNRLIDSGGLLASPPSINYKEQPLLLLHLVRADLTAYTGLLATDVFTAAIDNDFDGTTDLMCLTSNSGINVPGDWASVSVAGGKLSIRLDAFTATFKSKLGTSSQLTNTYFELQAVPLGETYLSSIFRFQIYCNGLVNDGGVTPPEPESDYYTKAQVDANFVELVESSAVTINNSLTATTLLATTFDTNVAAAGVTLAGTTLAADGTDADIDISITPKGTGEVNLPKVDIDAGTIDATTIGGSTPAAGAFTTLKATTGAAANSTLISDANGNLSYLKNNLVATTAPGATDDSAAGYSVLSLWLNTSTTEIYRCLDATEGAAVWEQTTLTLDDLGSMATQNANSVAITGGAIDGATIGGTTPGAVTATTATATTFDTGVLAAGVTLAGTTLSADGTDADISITVTPKGTGSVVISKADINAGTIDGATIATSDITVGSGKTLNVSDGTLTLAADQISGDKVEGGTINAITINTLTSTTVNGTTFDTNVTAAGVTLSGTTLSADGSDSNINIAITPKGTGEVDITKIDCDGGAIDGTTIGGTTPAAVTATTATANAFVPNSATVPANGLFLPAANTLGLATNSAERMRIDSTGKVGINTNSPQTPLHIAFDGTSSTIAGLSVEATAGTYAKLGIVVPEVVDNTARITFGTSNSDYGASTGVLGGMVAKITQANPSTLKSDLYFTTNGGDSVTEKMRINSSGNLLVGTSSDPSTAARLVVKGSTADASTDCLALQDSGGVEVMAVDTDGNLNCKSLSLTTDDYIYLKGSASVDGSVRMSYLTSADAVLYEKRVSGAWITKQILEMA